MQNFMLLLLCNKCYVTGNFIDCKSAFKYKSCIYRFLERESEKLVKLGAILSKQVELSKENFHLRHGNKTLSYLRHPFILNWKPLSHFCSHQISQFPFLIHILPGLLAAFARAARPWRFCRCMLPVASPVIRNAC